MFSFIIYILIAAIGFMMGYLYHKSNTTAQFFKFDPNKALRVFITIFVIAVAVTYFLSWLTMHTLASTQIPDESSMQYQNTKSVMIFLLNLFFLVLMVAANVYSQSVKKISPVPYLLAFGFYVLFVIKDAYYISDYFQVWKQSLNIIQGDIPDLHSKGLMKTVLAFVVTAFNAFMIWWGMRKK